MMRRTARRVLRFGSSTPRRYSSTSSVDIHPQSTNGVRPLSNAGVAFRNSHARLGRNWGQSRFEGLSM
jgi:hypothetical protein